MAKDENPGLWDTSSAGHVDSGETYDECAHRELWEELHIKGTLKPLTKIEACRETYQEHVQVYICKTDATIIINQDEISEGKYFDWYFLQKEVKKKPEQFILSFKLILINYAKKILMDTQIVL